MAKDTLVNCLCCNKLFYIWAILLFVAAPAAAQVKFDVRLEKPHYLTGEPVFVVVDIKNVSDEPIGYLKCNDNVQLSVSGVEPRKNPNIFGCSSGIGTGLGCGSGNLPMILPGQVATSKYLLKGYDLKPGQYRLAVSGRIGVTIPGAQLDHELSLTVATASEGELQESFDPLISDAVFDPLKFDLNGSHELRVRLLELRAYARDAIIESAAPFLEPLIMRFVEEGNDSAISALGRIASESGRSYLKELYRVSDERRRSSIMWALALAGHEGDAGFFVEVLKDETIDSTPNSPGMSIKEYAALGLGHIGGDQAARYLESTFTDASPEVRSHIVTALGNTRSRLAVSILLGIYSYEVYGALRTLTHHAWDLDIYTTFTNRKPLLRWWEKNKYKFPIFGTDNCPVEPPARTFAGTYILANKQQEASSVVKNMTPVAAGQWADFSSAMNGEAGRADRIDFEFRQNDIVFVGEAAMPEVFVRDGSVQSDKNFRIRIPPRLKPGTVMVRTRTWFDNVVSEWSEPAAFNVLEYPSQTSIRAITLISASLKPQIEEVIYDKTIDAQTGDTLILQGHFPVKRADDLRIQLKNARKTLKIQAFNESGNIIVEIPPQTTPGEWELIVDAKDKKIRPQTVATIRIEQQNPE